MGTKMISPFAEEQRRMSSQIYEGDEASPLEDWHCSSRIPANIALSIYQRNLHVGVAQHLEAHFPVAYGYIGKQAYQFICAKYLCTSPPAQSIFTLYAAHFPGFLIEYGEQNPQQLLWSVAAQLAQIDFFHHNTFCEGQQIVVERTYYQLWINTKSVLDGSEQVSEHGLYQQLDLHPEQYQQLTNEHITLTTFWENGELFFGIAQ